MRIQWKVQMALKACKGGAQRNASKRKMTVGIQAI